MRGLRGTSREVLAALPLTAAAELDCNGGIEIHPAARYAGACSGPVTVAISGAASR